MSILPRVFGQEYPGFPGKKPRGFWGKNPGYSWVKTPGVLGGNPGCYWNGGSIARLTVIGDSSSYSLAGSTGRTAVTITDGTSEN